MKKVIEVEYPDHNVEKEFEQFIKDNLITEDGSLAKGAFRSHIIIEWIPND